MFEPPSKPATSIVAIDCAPPSDAKRWMPERTVITQSQTSATQNESSGPS